MVYEYFHKKIPTNKTTKPLVEEIKIYVDEILKEEIPQISYKSYMSFYKDGIRKEFEDIYFRRRKQLSALGLYMQFEGSEDTGNLEKVVNYFNELLWSISNEFSWCLAAHLKYDKDGFAEDPDKIIDLFSAETAQALSELLIIHEDKIDKSLKNHIKKRINERVIEPFLNNTWDWESQTHNWNAVCSGCMGIVGLLIANEGKQKEIIYKVEKALKYYLSGFGDDGASLEGVGYWTYGFGYYNYYKALKGEIFDENYNKVKTIANFPNIIQISENTFVPFSDVPVNMSVATGLLSYLYKNYNIKVPFVTKISSLDFDQCFRWAHLSRNLWWTTEEIFNKKPSDSVEFLEDAQWMVLRKDKVTFAIKGGNNEEPHNHNDLGSFIVAVNGNIVLTDLGAGLYTAGYFGEERYSYDQTRSYWHSVPLINNLEQIVGTKKCEILNRKINNSNVELELDLTYAYPEKLINSCTREVIYSKDILSIKDKFKSSNNILINEGFISSIPSKLINEGKIMWEINNDKLVLEYNPDIFKYSLEEKKVINHYNQINVIYRSNLIAKEDVQSMEEKFNIYISYDKNSIAN